MCVGPGLHPCETIWGVCAPLRESVPVVVVVHTKFVDGDRVTHVPSLYLCRILCGLAPPRMAPSMIESYAASVRTACMLVIAPSLCVVLDWDLVS